MVSASRERLAGHLTWADYRPTPRGRTQSSRCSTRPVRKSCRLSPELASRPFPNSQRTSTLERLGAAIVLMQPKPQGEQIPGPAKPFLLRTARMRVRRAAKKAGLPDWPTLAACRHGGLSELGDAVLTEQSVMALSGHQTPEAARLYMKRTDLQREAALLKCRAWVQAITVEGRPAEQEVDKRRNRAPAGE